jgi:hypothetical protein
MPVRIIKDETAPAWGWESLGRLGAGPPGAARPDLDVGRSAGDRDGERIKILAEAGRKAERMARAVSDAEISQSFRNMAKAYRSQADMLKSKKAMAKKKSGKKRR